MLKERPTETFQEKKKTINVFVLRFWKHYEKPYNFKQILEWKNPWGNVPVNWDIQKTLKSLPTFNIKSQETPDMLLKRQWWNIAISCITTREVYYLSLQSCSWEQESLMSSQIFIYFQYIPNPWSSRYVSAFAVFHRCRAGLSARVIWVLNGEGRTGPWQHVESVSLVESPEGHSCRCIH